MGYLTFEAPKKRPAPARKSESSSHPVRAPDGLLPADRSRIRARSQKSGLLKTILQRAKGLFQPGSLHRTYINHQSSLLPTQVHPVSAVPCISSACSERVEPTPSAPFFAELTPQGLPAAPHLPGDPEDTKTFLQEPGAFALGTAKRARLFPQAARDAFLLCWWEIHILIPTRNGF